MLLYKKTRTYLLQISLVYIFLVVGTLHAIAQDSTKPSPKKTFKNFINPDSLPLMNLRIVPIPILTSTPETGIRYGAALEYFFNAKEKGKQSEARGSYIHGQITHSTKGQVEIKGSWQVFTKGEKYVYRGSAGFATFTDRIWGVGNNTLAEKNYYSQDFNRNFIESRNYKLLKNQWYLGIRLDYNDIYKVKIDKPLDPVNALIPGIQGSKILGIGPAILYEGRDFPFSAHTGGFLEASYTQHFPIGGDSYKFQIWLVDLRKFYPLSKQTTFAVQLLSQSASGNVPLSEIPKMGGATMMRGYFTGRYRDRSYTAAQAEIRYHLWRWIYGATFAAAGVVDQSISKYQIANARLAGGLGLRFLVNKKNRMFLRVDYALNSTEGGAYYLRLNEAF
ncbi:MAG: outer membrane protein [Chitinophagaceae bacterium]|nr:MAG: outer membrane [Chitinophagaceae bacterium]TXT34165.1 MAG: outer membrane protein [Chitinophagaceae bacterium]